MFLINSDTAAQLQTDQATGAAPVLLYGFDGFIDAGMAAGLVINDITTALEPHRLVSFDADQLVDYRERRPPMVLGSTGWESINKPELAIDLAYDTNGRPFLLMFGPEPDLRWEAFAQGVRQVAEDFGVKQALGMCGLPMPVPHTRPLTTTFPTSGEMLTGASALAAGRATRLQVPGSAMALIELRLAEAGLDSRSAAVHVPQYLSAMPYPTAAVALVGQINRATGLALETTRLAEAADQTNREIARQVEANDEVGHMVGVLEERFDAAHGPRALLTEDALPSADDIAAELEAFLATQFRPDGDEAAS